MAHVFRDLVKVHKFSFGLVSSLSCSGRVLVFLLPLTPLIKLADFHSFYWRFYGNSDFIWLRKDWNLSCCRFLEFRYTCSSYLVE